MLVFNKCIFSQINIPLRWKGGRATVTQSNSFNEDLLQTVRKIFASSAFQNYSLRSSLKRFRGKRESFPCETSAKANLEGQRPGSAGTNVMSNEPIPRLSLMVSRYSGEFQNAKAAFLLGHAVIITACASTHPSSTS